MTEQRRDKPWIFRTYSGHSNARESNALYRKNLAKGQTGLSVAFDLPTQTGYDSDHILARGEVGKVGVPICHLGDMRALFEQIPLDEMNTSMTINATAAWLLALYIAVADEQGVPRAKLQGTTQNDIVKEYLSRGTYVFPPAPSMRLIKDTILFTTAELPKWNPMNVCSYHLQEAGATPVQELAYALATAIAVLDTVKASGEVKPEAFRRGGRAHLVLRQRGPALHHRDVQDARVLRTVGRDHARALRRHRSEAAAVPLRRAGELARADRAAGGEQRLPHPDRDAGGDALEERARPRRAAARLERGARPAAPVRPAMVAAHAADPRLRDRPARIRRHLRRLEGDRQQGRGVEARGARRALRHREARRRDRGGRDGLHEGAARRQQLQARRGDRARRADRGRRQQVPRKRAVAARRPAKARSSPCRRRSRPSRSSGSRPGARRATTRP